MCRWELKIPFLSDRSCTLRTICMGLNCQKKGSHSIFYRETIDEIINIQEIKSYAKFYQVKFWIP